MSTAFERGQQAQEEFNEAWQALGWASLQEAMRANGEEYLDTLTFLEESESEEAENLRNYYRGLLSRLD